MADSLQWLSQSDYRICITSDSVASGINSGQLRKKNHSLGQAMGRKIIGANSAGKCFRLPHLKFYYFAKLQLMNYSCKKKHL